MMLRESGPHNDEQLDGWVHGRASEGLECDEALLQLTDTLIRDRAFPAKELSNALQEQLTPEGFVDAVGVIAHFDAITKIADGTGIQLDQGMATATEDMRDTLGLNRMHSS